MNETPIEAGQAEVRPQNDDMSTICYYYGDKAVRVVKLPEGPVFIASDICACLGLKSPRTSLAAVPEKERGVHTVDVLGVPHPTAYVTEQGLIHLVFKSRKPEAIPFGEWVVNSLLRGLRKEADPVVRTEKMEVQVFEGASMRLVQKDGEPWFVAADAAAILDITQVASTLRSFPEDERGVHRLHTPGGEQDMTILNEPGLFRLIFQSRKPAAERFKKWVFGEVLPAIRRTGSYSLPSAPPPVPAGLGYVLPVWTDESIARLVAPRYGSKGAMVVPGVMRELGVDWRTAHLLLDEALAAGRLTGNAWDTLRRGPSLPATVKWEGLTPRELEEVRDQCRRQLACLGEIETWMMGRLSE